MKRTILAAALLAAGAVGLLAQPAGKAAQAAPAQAPKGPAPKSQAELQALQALQAAVQGTDLDAIIKTCEDLLTRFPDTDFKDTVLTSEADAYQQKGDWIKAQIFAEQAIATNPKAANATLMLADILSKHTGEHDLDRDEKLTKAEASAHQAIELVAAQPKPPQVPDAAWDGYKKQLTAQAQDDLGLVFAARKSWDSAAATFRTAIAQHAGAGLQSASGKRAATRRQARRSPSRSATRSWPSPTSTREFSRRLRASGPAPSPPRPRQSSGCGSCARSLQLWSPGSGTTSPARSCCAAH